MTCASMFRRNSTFWEISTLQKGMYNGKHHYTIILITRWPEAPQDPLSVKSRLIGSCIFPAQFLVSRETWHSRGWNGDLEKINNLLIVDQVNRGKNAQGWMPLHLAVWTRQTIIVERILESPRVFTAISEPNHQYYGVTALHLAGLNGD